jgi:hypothetical protein
MLTALDKSFPFSIHGKRSVVRRLSRTVFEQSVPIQVTPYALRTAKFVLEPLSRITSNQSLSPEQLAKSRSKFINEKLTFLADKYEIGDLAEIKNFLTKNRFLITQLEEIPEKIAEYFGINQRLSLKVTHETGFPHYGELWISILTELSVDEAFQNLEKFDHEWWLDNLERTNFKINISLEYI